MEKDMYDSPNVAKNPLLLNNRECYSQMANRGGGINATDSSYSTCLKNVRILETAYGSRCRPSGFFVFRTVRGSIHTTAKSLWHYSRQICISGKTCCMQLWRKSRMTNGFASISTSQPNNPT